MKQRNIPYAVATSSHRPNVDFDFKTLHLERWFSHENFIYHDGTFPGKPAPDIYLRAAARIQCAPARVFVVGRRSGGNSGGPKCRDPGDYRDRRGKREENCCAENGIFPVIADYRSVDFNEGTASFIRRLKGENNALLCYSKCSTCKKAKNGWTIMEFLAYDRDQNGESYRGRTEILA